eukprot:TRINITY_DN44635_c0_g1_i1.p1 TRINITY_DN44635_c0_g1~~TRINITY_DN44635_c0_g1_i1.p1  ORF type:complete len:354 (-),score=47.19 TRINITY_DN44635_c0_g1_i1:139-1101(-)
MDADSSRRADLRDVVARLTRVEALSKNAFLLAASSSNDDDAEKAVVQVEVVKPCLEDPQVLWQLLNASLVEGTQGTWFSNDRYCKKTSVGACDAVVEIVHPAHAKDIFKRKTVEFTRRIESPDEYSSVTFPRMVAHAAKKDAWVANIIEGRKEQEHVVTELGCDMMLVVKDYKWQDTSNANNLYYLSIFKDMTVRSLRNLDGSKHLNALLRIRDEVIVGLASKHGVPVEHLIPYIHYHPTFWYFHVHIVNCKHSMFCGDGSQNLLLSAMDRFHKLETVIALLESNTGYYQKASLPILLQPHQLAWYAAGTEPSTKRSKLA